MADDGRSRLGRGLAALIGDVGEETKTAERTRNQRRVPIEFLKRNPRNPRKNFSDTELDELTASIRERGIIQPIVVRAVRGATDSFEIIAGERRWRAAQRAGLHDVPIVPVEVTDDEALQLAIIENVQRTDLNPLEEAMGYQALVADFHHTHDDIAKTVGKSRVHITNTLRLLKLPESIQTFIHSGKLTAGHARMLIGQPNADALAQEIISRGLNVRQAEQLTREAEGGKSPGKGGPRARGGTAKSADTEALERRLSDRLGLKVVIEDRDGRGVLQIHYRSLDQLDAVIRKLDD
jgi:ParB family chromosome partitioning protein